MTDSEIKEVLKSDELSQIEESITEVCKTYVNKEFIDFTIGVVRREITNSNLSLEYLKKQIAEKKESLIKFGIRFMLASKNAPIEEEYPEGEGVPRNERPKVISSQGFGIGFGIKYAIYLDFLENNPKELINYIKKERIPKAQKLNDLLIKLYG